MRYADMHPRASDTVDGIRDFWLAMATEASTPELESILAELVTAGVFAVTELPNGVELYSVNSERR